MSDAVSFAELEAQHVEVLPARTVLSTLSTPGESSANSGTNSPPSLGTTAMSLLGINPGGNGADGTNTDGDGGAENT
jgi:hypothetical protein